MNSKEIIKLAKENGWEIKSQKGSHVKMIHKNYEKPAIIPYHGTKEIGKGTLNSILKQLGLK